MVVLGRSASTKTGSRSQSTLGRKWNLGEDITIVNAPQCAGQPIPQGNCRIGCNIGLTVTTHARLIQNLEQRPATSFDPHICACALWGDP